MGKNHFITLRDPANIVLFWMGDGAAWHCSALSSTQPCRVMTHQNKSHKLDDFHPKLGRTLCKVVLCNNLRKIQFGSSGPTSLLQRDNINRQHGKWGRNSSPFWFRHFLLDSYILGFLVYYFLWKASPSEKWFLSFGQQVEEGLVVLQLARWGFSGGLEGSLYHTCRQKFVLPFGNTRTVLL